MNITDVVNFLKNLAKGKREMDLEETGQTEETQAEDVVEQVADVDADAPVEDTGGVPADEVVEVEQAEEVADEAVEEVADEIQPDTADDAVEEVADDVADEVADDPVAEEVAPFNQRFSTGIESFRASIAARNSAWQSTSDAQNSLDELKAQVAAAEANLNDMSAAGADADASVLDAADGIIALLEEFKATL